MKSISDDVQNEIIDVLTKYGSLSYSELYYKIKKTKNDRTFRKVLDIMNKNKIIKRKKSKDDHRKIIYSIRGFEVESINNRVLDYDQLLSKYEDDLLFHVNAYLKYKKFESNKSELAKHRLKLAKSTAVLLECIFELNQTVLFLKLIGNIPILRKTENLYKNHLRQSQMCLDSLRKNDYESFKLTMAVSVLKSDISVPGLI